MPVVPAAVVHGLREAISRGDAFRGQRCGDWRGAGRGGGECQRTHGAKDGKRQKPVHGRYSLVMLRTRLLQRRSVRVVDVMADARVLAMNLG
jgi:hypothetical protein